MQTVLELQRHAGNRAVSHLLGPRVQRAPGGGASGAGASAAGRSAGAGAPTTSVAPPEGGVEIDRLGVVDQEGSKSDDGRPGLNIRPAPSGRNTPLGRIEDRKHLIAKRDMGGGWMYAVVTDGALRGTAGYVQTHNLVNFNMPPDPAAPDPEAYLYRVKPGDRAHQLVREVYGASNIETGQDQRFFTNVLKYINDRAQRGGAFNVKTKTQQHGVVAYEVDDIELVAGRQIWIPGLAFAQSLKGTVSRGSWARDIAEKVKDWGRKLAAIPAFIGGLVVGALESIRDLFVGLFDLVWNAIKTLGGSLVDAAKAIWGLITDPRKRRQLLEAMNQRLLDMIGPKVSFLRRAYNWGRIIGYATMEVVSTILLAGVANAVKASRWGASLAGMLEVIGDAPAIKRITGAAERIAESPIGAGIRKAVAPVGKAVEKVGGAVEKVGGAPAKLVLKSAEVLAERAAKLGSRFGWKSEQLLDAARIMDQQGVKLYLRTSSKWSPARMAEGAIPKPVAIKANTINELDVIIGPGFTDRDLGLVGHFEPVPSERWVRPKGMSDDEWEKLQPALRKRAEKRARSYRKYDKDMKRLTRPTRTKGGEYYRIERGIVKQVEVGEGGQELVRALTGDIDAFALGTLSGGKVSRGKAERVEELLVERDVTEHGIHAYWQHRRDFDPDAFYTIIESHLKDPVIEIGPNLVPREVTADQVPEIAEILSSRQYRNWKRSRMVKAMRSFLVGLGVGGSSAHGASR